MFRTLFKFIAAVAHHWGTLVTGGSIIGLLAIWQGTGHHVPPYIFWFVAIIALFAAFFKAWKAELDAKEAAISQRVAIVRSTTWQQLRVEKKQLEDELEIEEKYFYRWRNQLNPGSLPDDPNAWFDPRSSMSEQEQDEYATRNRKAARLRENIELIKEKLKSTF